MEAWNRMVNMNKKPPPLYLAPVRGKCPVCGHTSYSSTGIHPQCAMQVADRAQLQKLRERRPVETKPVVSTPGPRPFERLCPRCKAIVHVRRIACRCGYELTAK
jgi:hypothetical protein